MFYSISKSYFHSLSHYQIQKQQTSKDKIMYLTRALACQHHRKIAWCSRKALLFHIKLRLGELKIHVNLCRRLLQIYITDWDVLFNVSFFKSLHRNPFYIDGTGNKTACEDKRNKTRNQLQCAQCLV